MRNPLLEHDWPALLRCEQSAPTWRAGTLAAIALLMPMSFAAAADTSAAMPIQAPEAIEAAAQAFVAGQLGRQSEDTRIDVSGLDSRLRLPACGRTLEAFSPPGSVSTTARSTVGVRCNGPRPWKVYVTVSIERQDSVVVARHGLSRGTILAAGDLQVVRMNVSRLRNGYQRSLDTAIGKRLRHGVAAGEPLTGSVLEQRRLIERGQRVTLVSGGAAVAITMAGIAAGDGALGDRVVARNLSSGREVEGIVRSQHEIEVLAP